MKLSAVSSAMRHILSASLVSAVLLCLPLFASGQQFPQLAVEKAKETAISSRVGLPGSDAEIDKEIERIKTQVDKLHAESTGAGAEVTEGGALGLASSADEVREQERVKSELVIDLDRQIDVLKELKEIRRDNASYELERKSWRGFKEKPPFPIAFIDDIRDSLLSQRLAFESFELRLSLARTSFKRFDDELKKSRKALRFAEEESSRSRGTPGEQRNRWLLDLAKVKNERNEVGLVLAEMQRLTYESAVNGKRQQISFFEEKLRAAEASSPLSKEDFEKKLTDLDRQRRDLEIELQEAQKSEVEARKKLDVIRDAITSLSASVQEKEPLQGVEKKTIRTIVSPREKKLPVEAKLQLLMLDFEAQQAVADTARLRITSLKGRIQSVNLAEKIWRDRYWLNQRRDLKEIREKQDEVNETIARLGIIKRYADSSLASWMNLIKNQKDRIASLVKSDPAVKTQMVILSAYEERQNNTLRMIENIGRLERLIGRLKDELTDRIKQASITSRFKERLQETYSFVKAIWNTELYVATETTVIDDRSIAKPVSVTIGKVVKALIILFIGTWFAGKIARAIQWALTKRLKWPRSKASPFRKIAFGVMFICVLIFSFVTVNIPLAVFTFLGGALAIGLGFGAQHLINNFISSLILLFDRSIKVGDIVEVDGEGGRVMNIGMRNSRIHRFDGIDMLVPNSKFLQEKVTNWTLDPRMRYSVSVGVAYGSPTRETERVIMKAIERHPMVLKDPPPTILFDAFGDSSLLFTGYFWMELISNRDNRIVVSEIRHTITELLGKAGIVISFPQRDVHLNSSKPLEVKVLLQKKDGEKQ